MSFFLLGRMAGSELRLLSTDSFETRAQAMAELQRLTADASFTEWDAEVFVVDLNAATPVLLVRPTTEPAEVPGADQPADEEVPVDEVDAASTAQDAEDAFAVAAAPVDEGDAVPVDVDLTLPEEPVVAEAEDVAASEEPAPEPVDAAFADAALADAAADLDAEAPDTLKDALRRAAEDLESEGIVAPESIGPAEQAAEDTAGAPSEEPVGEPLDEPAEEPVAEAAEEAAEEAAGEAAEEATAESEPVAWPWDTAASADDSQSEDVLGSEEGGAEAPDATTEAIEGLDAAPVTPYVFDPLEEPAIDATPLVTAEGDDATVAASRPVILGAYENAAPAEPSSAPEPSAEIEVEQAESDFILDLESIAGIADTPADLTQADSDPSVVSPEAAAALEAPTPVDGALAGMTCGDCVYVETCPNKDQREPATCGSFQWRTE